MQREHPSAITELILVIETPDDHNSIDKHIDCYSYSTEWQAFVTSHFKDTTTAVTTAGYTVPGGLIVHSVHLYLNKEGREEYKRISGTNNDDDDDILMEL